MPRRTSRKCGKCGLYFETPQARAAHYRLLHKGDAVRMVGIAHRNRSKKLRKREVRGSLVKPDGHKSTFCPYCGINVFKGPGVKFCVGCGGPIKAALGHSA